MPLRHFLTCLDSNEYQTLGFLMFPHQEYVWFISCIFNIYCPTSAFSMHCTQPSLAHTFATLVMHWSIPCFFILACHVYIMLCSILFCLKFELHFLSHLATLMHHYHCSYLHLFPSFLLDLLSIPDKKGIVYSREYTGVFCHFYMTLVHNLRGRNSISHAHLQEEKYSIREMHIPRGRRH